MVRRIALMTLAAAAWLPSAQASEPGDTTCAATIDASIDALSRGDYAGAAKAYSTDLAQHHDAPNLAQTWSKLQGIAGAYQRRDDGRWLTVDGTPYRLTTVTFATRSFEAVNACDTTGKLSTAEWGPASDAAAKIAQAKPVVLDKGVREMPLDLPSPIGPLPGTLTLPAGKGPFPVALLLVGSGPQDEDEAIGPNKPFRDLADGLAADGVASFRYDKRTYAYRTEAALDKHLTVDDEVVTDALAALSLLRKEPGIDDTKVFVVGHSLGAMLTPRIGQRDGHVAGLVMMASPARSLLDVSAQQVREQGQKQGLPEQQIATRLQAIENERSMLANARPGEILEGSFGGAPQSYWSSLQGNDPVAIARQLTVPMLILQGAADFQVSPSADFASWQRALAGRHDVTFHLYPNLSHIFMPAGSTGTVKDYDIPGHVAPEVIRDMSAWIKG